MRALRGADGMAGAALRGVRGQAAGVRARAGRGRVRRARAEGRRGLEGQRGHHAAERLARELSARWELPLQPLLSRRRGSRRQRGLPQPERRRNVAVAFLVERRPPSRVVLVDDVYTTGATVNAAASALRQAGAGKVEVVTFARTIRIR